MYDRLFVRRENIRMYNVHTDTHAVWYTQLTIIPVVVWPRVPHRRIDASHRICSIHTIRRLLFVFVFVAIGRIIPFQWINITFASEM